MKNLNSKEVNKFIGKIYYFDRELYGQINSTLKSWLKVQSMLEEVKDKTIEAYLIHRKGVLLDEILRFTTRRDYPNYPEMEEETVR